MSAFVAGEKLGNETVLLRAYSIHNKFFSNSIIFARPDVSVSV